MSSDHVEIMKYECNDLSINVRSYREENTTKFIEKLRLFLM